MARETSDWQTSHGKYCLKASSQNWKEKFVSEVFRQLGFFSLRSEADTEEAKKANSSRFSPVFGLVFWEFNDIRSFNFKKKMWTTKVAGTAAMSLVQRYCLALVDKPSCAANHALEKPTHQHDFINA